MKILVDKDSKINRENFLSLLNYWEKFCKYKAFATHPINLIVFFPNTKIVFYNKNKSICLLAQDRFAQYAPIAPYGLDKKNTTATYNILLPQKRFFPHAYISPYDWHFCYFPNRMRHAFKKRRNLIRRAENNKIVIKKQLPSHIKIKGLIQAWADSKETASQEEKIILESNAQIQDRFYSETIKEIRNANLPAYVFSAYFKRDLVGLSSAVRIGNEFVVLFEISLSKLLPELPSFIFYNTWRYATDIGAPIINTLGHDNIYALKKNKSLYKPAFTLPLYKAG